MKRIVIFFFLLIFCESIYSLDIVINSTQLDKKLDSIKKSKRNDSFEFNILRKIEIRGLENLSEEVIKNVLNVFIGDKLDPFTINRNLKKIESTGLFDSVNSDVEEYDGGKKWIITVIENPVIKTISFEGNTVISNNILVDNINSKVGEIFNFSKVREDSGKIEKVYSDQGYLFSRITKIDMPTRETPELIFHIQESSYSEILVSGNIKTKDYVILREMNLKAGEIVNQKKLMSNLQRIFNLNYFSEVIPNIQPSTTTKNAYSLQINVTEKSTDSVNFGGGWGQQSGGFLYSDLNINNLFGTGQLVALKGQWGNRAQTYQFKYYNPWMFGKRKSLMFRAWNTKGNFGYNNFMSSGYRPETRYGVDVSVGLPHSYELRSNHKVRLEKVRVDEDDDEDDRDYSVQSYTYSLSYDTRDVKFSPLNGVYYVSSIENAFKIYSNSLVFTKFDIRLSNFFQTQKNQTIATRLIIGRINGNIESTEYYFVGGPNTVRGYVEYPDSFGYGKTQLVGNIEYRFLLSDIFQLLFFIDAGWASSLGDNIFNGKIGKGVGFRVNSPLGPIRIDFGIDEIGEMRTHFNIGHVF